MERELTDQQAPTHSISQIWQLSCQRLQVDREDSTLYLN